MGVADFGRRAAADAEVAADLLAPMYETDVRDDLPGIRAVSAAALGCWQWRVPGSPLTGSHPGRLAGQCDEADDTDEVDD